jgi:hypothetical protein
MPAGKLEGKEEKEDNPMKKGMMVMAIVAALSFLVSIIAVSASLAGLVTQTTPEKVSAKKEPPKSQALKNIVHTKFWVLDVDHCVVNNFNPCNAVNTVKKGPLTGKCYYMVKTPPINEITEADVTAWSSKAYTLLTSITNNNTAKTLKEDDQNAASIYLVTGAILEKRRAR